MIDPKLIKDLVPLVNLSATHLERLAERLELEYFPKGTVLARQGDTDNLAIYVIDGGVELISTQTTFRRVVQGGTTEAAYPLTQARPRDATITSTTDVQILRIDNHFLDRAVLLDMVTTTTGDVEVPEDVTTPEDPDAWFDEMLRSEQFRNVPTEKLGALMLKMEPIRVLTGDIVVKQGDPGNYYYIIKQGRFSVSRKDNEGKVKILIELKVGEVFGEESLVTGKGRNASVVALTGGLLLRLSKKDFDELLKRPLLRFVKPTSVDEILSKGGKFLDVRPAQLYARGALKDSINIPMSMLRKQMDALDPKAQYIVCCDTGIQSQVAGFLLSHRGYNVWVLQGGLQKFFSSPVA
jgi:CRP-like cAMP-binding protein